MPALTCALSVPPACYCVRNQSAAANIYTFSRVLVIAALLTVASTFAALPLLIKERTGQANLTTQSKPLTGSQIMRGAYLNSGSKDAGADPDWQFDPRTGKYTYVGNAAGSFQPSQEQVEEARSALEARKAGLK